MSSTPPDVSFGKGTISSATQLMVLEGRYFHSTIIQLKRRFLRRHFSQFLSSSFFFFF